MTTNTNQQELLSAESLEAAREAIHRSRNSLIDALAADVRNRLAIFEATKDAALAFQGIQWAESVGEALDPVTVRAALSGELGTRLGAAEVCIPEELFHLITQQPGLPAWTHRNPNGGLFYVAKVWALAEASGIDLRPIVCGPFLETL